jgi:hypothetical protein
VRAILGLRTSGARWHDGFANVNLMGFSPSKADPEAWMHD